MWPLTLSVVPIAGSSRTTPPGWLASYAASHASEGGE